MNNNYFIEDIFQENKFNKFVAYCKEHDIVSMSDLEGFDFEQLNNVKGIGKGKINDVISRYNEINELEQQKGEEETQDAKQAEKAAETEAKNHAKKGKGR